MGWVDTPLLKTKIKAEIKSRKITMHIRQQNHTKTTTKIKTNKHNIRNVTLNDKKNKMQKFINLTKKLNNIKLLAVNGLMIIELIQLTDAMFRSHASLDQSSRQIITGK